MFGIVSICHACAAGVMHGMCKSDQGVMDDELCAVKIQDVGAFGDAARISMATCYSYPMYLPRPLPRPKPLICSGASALVP